MMQSAMTPVASPAADESTLRWMPASPVVIDDIDVSEHPLTDIALRHVSQRGTCTIHLLSSLMKLSLELAEGLFPKLIDQQLFEVRRMGGDDYVFALSPTGRRTTVERSVNVRYAGPAPVSLAAYTASARAQTSRFRVNRDIYTAGVLRHRGKRRDAGCHRPRADFAATHLSLWAERHG